MRRTLLVVVLFGLCRADSELKCDNTTLHEVSACMHECPPERTCQNFRGPEPPCVPPSAPCTQKCVCGPETDKCPGYNQYFACDGPYDENCSGSCHCASGYARDANNTCVSTTPPPAGNPAPPPPPPPVIILPSPVGPPQPVTTKPQQPMKLTCDNATLHEVPDCQYECPPEKTCQNRHWPYPLCRPSPYPCKPKCVCSDGYARNRDGGLCVTLEQFAKCDGKNEYFQCDGDFSEDCVGHCYCLSGYTRDIDGNCVYVDPAAPPKDLSPPAPGPTEITEPPQEPELKCDNTTLHEVLACIYGCPPEKTCQNRNWPPFPCAPPGFPCTPKCVCDDGYARNRVDGTCVTLQQCDRCPGENEYFQCDGDYCEDCVGHCYCFSGYTRDIDGNCAYVDPAVTPRPPNPTHPVNPINPVSPVKPVLPVKPAKPVRPVQREKPFETVFFYNL